MSRSFIFGFGKASDLSGRQLIIHEISDAPAVVSHNTTYGGTVEVSSEIALGPGRYRAALIDTRDNGTSRRMVGHFDGNEDQWPKILDYPLGILSSEEMSSSSSLSSTNAAIGSASVTRSARAVTLSSAIDPAFSVVVVAVVYIVPR